MDQGHLFIITHTDLDGVGSAAAALRILRRGVSEASILYAEPYNIHEKLENIESYIESGDLLIIADLGPNRDSFPRTIEILSRLSKKGVVIEWYDHHIWSPEDEHELRSNSDNVYLVVDRSTCATGVVVRYCSRRRGIEPDEFMLELESAVCAADLWRWDHPLAPKLFRVADSRYEEGREAWRNKLVEKFANGILWDEELEEKLEEYIDMELKNYNKILRTVYVTSSPCRVAVTMKKTGPPSNSFIGASLQSRFNADIAAIVRPNGGLSLRSKTVNVQKIAKSLGGGGHPRAAGARIRFPLWIRVLIPLLGGRLVSRYVANLIRRKSLELNICNY